MRRVAVLVALAFVLSGCRVWVILDATVLEDEFFEPHDVERLADGGIVVIHCAFDDVFGGGILIVHPGMTPEFHNVCDGPWLDASVGPDGKIYFSRNPDTPEGPGDTVRIDRLDPATGLIDTVFTLGFTAIDITTVVAAPDGRILYGSEGEIHEVTGLMTSEAVPGTDDLGQWDFAVDGAGTIYGVPTGAQNQQVVSVATDGTRTVVAGTGTAGFSGDGGPATAAQLSSPRGVDVAGNGDLLVADRSNNRIRRILANGTIRTAAGGGASTQDGAIAPFAELQLPSVVAFDGTQNFWFVEQGPDGPSVRYVGLGAAPAF